MQISFRDVPLNLKTTLLSRVILAYIAILDYFPKNINSQTYRMKIRSRQTLVFAYL